MRVCDAAGQGLAFTQVRGDKVGNCPADVAERAYPNSDVSNYSTCGSPTLG
jgi:hypothetical protein